jgi:hypothetical protein
MRTMGSGRGTTWGVEGQRRIGEEDLSSGSRLAMEREREMRTDGLGRLSGDWGWLTDGPRLAVERERLTSGDWRK